MDNDRIQFMSRTIIGLKSALLQAEKQSRQFQKVALNCYVQSAKFETESLELKTQFLKMKNNFEKEKKELESKLAKVEEQACETEKENVNLNFIVKELKAYDEQKTKLLEALEKDSKFKSSGQVITDKELLESVKQLLKNTKECTASKELKRCVRRCERKELAALSKCLENELIEDNADVNNEVNFEVTIMDTEPNSPEQNLAICTSETVPTQIVSANKDEINFEITVADTKQNDFSNTQNLRINTDPQTVLTPFTPVTSPVVNCDPSQAENIQLISANTNKVEFTITSTNTERSNDHLTINAESRAMHLLLPPANPPNKNLVVNVGPQFKNMELIPANNPSCIENLTVKADPPEAMPTQLMTTNSRIINENLLTNAESPKTTSTQLKLLNNSIRNENPMKNTEHSPTMPIQFSLANENITIDTPQTLHFHSGPDEQSELKSNSCVKHKTNNLRSLENDYFDYVVLDSVVHSVLDEVTEVKKLAPLVNELKRFYEEGDGIIDKCHQSEEMQTLAELSPFDTVNSEKSPKNKIKNTESVDVEQKKLQIMDLSHFDKNLQPNSKNTDFEIKNPKVSNAIEKCDQSNEVPTLKEVLLDAVHSEMLTKEKRKNVKDLNDVEQKKLRIEDVNHFENNLQPNSNNDSFEVENTKVSDAMIEKSDQSDEILSLKETPLDAVRLGKSPKNKIKNIRELEDVNLKNLQVTDVNYIENNLQSNSYNTCYEIRNSKVPNVIKKTNKSNIAPALEVPRNTLRSKKLARDKRKSSTDLENIQQKKLRIVEVNHFEKDLQLNSSKIDFEFKTPKVSDVIIKSPDQSSRIPPVTEIPVDAVRSRKSPTYKRKNITELGDVEQKKLQITDVNHFENNSQPNSNNAGFEIKNTNVSDIVTENCSQSDEILLPKEIPLDAVRLRKSPRNKRKDSTELKDIEQRKLRNTGINYFENDLQPNSNNTDLEIKNTNFSDVITQKCDQVDTLPPLKEMPLDTVHVRKSPRNKRKTIVELKNVEQRNLQIMDVNHFEKDPQPNSNNASFEIKNTNVSDIVTENCSQSDEILLPKEIPLDAVRLRKSPRNKRKDSTELKDIEQRKLRNTGMNYFENDLQPNSNSTDLEIKNTNFSDVITQKCDQVDTLLPLEEMPLDTVHVRISPKNKRKTIVELKNVEQRNLQIMDVNHFEKDPQPNSNNASFEIKNTNVSDIVTENYSQSDEILLPKEIPLDAVRLRKSPRNKRKDITELKDIEQRKLRNTEIRSTNFSDVITQKCDQVDTLLHLEEMPLDTVHVRKSPKNKRKTIMELKNVEQKNLQITDANYFENDPQPNSINVGFEIKNTKIPEVMLRKNDKSDDAPTIYEMPLDAVRSGKSTQQESKDITELRDVKLKKLQIIDMNLFGNDPQLNSNNTSFEIKDSKVSTVDIFAVLHELSELHRFAKQGQIEFMEFALREDSMLLRENYVEGNEFIVIAEVLPDQKNGDDEESPEIVSFEDKTIAHSLNNMCLKTMNVGTTDFSCDTSKMKDEAVIESTDSGEAMIFNDEDTSDDDSDSLFIAEDICTMGQATNDDRPNSDNVFTCAAEKEKQLTIVQPSNFLVENKIIETEVQESSSISAVEKNEQSAGVKLKLPKFYVENELTKSEPKQNISAVDEVLNKIKEISYTLPSLENEASDLISCRKSMVNSVSYFKEGFKKPQKKKKIKQFKQIKHLLDTYMEESCKNYFSAMHTFISSVRKSNKATVCCVMVETCTNSATKDARNQKSTISQLLSLSFELEKQVFNGFLEDLKETIKIKIFSRDCIMKEGVNGYLVSCTILLSRFYAEICRSMDNAESVISLIYESLMSLKFRSHPIAYSILSVWPDVFRDELGKSQLIELILFSLVHHKMRYNQGMYKATEVQSLIGAHYKMKLGMKTAEEYAKEIMLNIFDKFWIEALALLCKRQQFTWAYTNVVMKYLLPILRQWKIQNFDKNIVHRILQALQAIMAACPKNENQRKIFNINAIKSTLENLLAMGKGMHTKELKKTITCTLRRLN